MLVGDVILQARVLIPDMPQTLTPTAITVGAFADSPGTAIPPGTYYVRVSFITSWGETNIGNEQVVTIGATQAFRVTGPTPYMSTGVTLSLRLYFGTVSGQQTSFITLSNISPNSSVNNILNLSLPISAGGVPQRNSSYLPDTDGGIFSATTLFGWMNEGLTEASRIAGGLLDYSGVPTTLGQPLYTLPNEWLKLTDVWYDGYPVAEIARSTMFRRNTVVSSIAGAVTVSVRDNRVIAEIWPQPARTAAQTSTIADRGVGDTSFSVATTGGFLLPFGFFMVSANNSFEIMSYAGLTGTTLYGCIRGLGGTAPQAWSTGSVVNELNLFVNGKRIFTTQYLPGMSGVTLPVPAGWSSIITTYILHRAKQSEQDYQESSRLKKQFDEMVTGWARTNNQIGGPRQITLRNDEFSIANPHPFGGTVVP